MTYRLPYAVAGRASHGVDVHAGHSPRSGGPRGLPPGRLGLRVVHFWPIRPDGRTSQLRLGSAVWALARQRCILARSSSGRRLAQVIGHRPRPLGVRLAVALLRPTEAVAGAAGGAASAWPRGERRRLGRGGGAGGAASSPLGGRRDEIPTRVRVSTHIVPHPWSSSPL